MLGNCCTIYGQRFFLWTWSISKLGVTRNRNRKFQEIERLIRHDLGTQEIFSLRHMVGIRQVAFLWKSLEQPRCTYLAIRIWNSSMKSENYFAFRRSTHCQPKHDPISDLYVWHIPLEAVEPRFSGQLQFFEFIRDSGKLISFFLS